jgi:hypothetical protein
MNIHPDSIREFLSRTRDAHDGLKRLPEARLRQELADLGFAPALRARPLLTHQTVCALLGIAYPAFAFWLDMGLGKSRLALELIRYHVQKGEMKGALILVKSDAAVITWEDQIAEWGFDLPYRLLLKGTSSKDKWTALEGFEEGVIIGSYGGVTRMLTKPGLSPKGKGKLVFDEPALKRMRGLVQCLVPDEATMLANADSLISRLFHQLRKSAPFCWQLAGIPFGRDPAMMHRQLYLIDQGETLGDTLGLFRAAFCKETKNRFGFSEYVFDRTKEQLLHKIVKHRSISYSEAECLDLPRVVQARARVHLPDEATAYYARFIAEIRKSKASFQVRKNAFIRMRQISSGYVGFTDDLTGERCEIEFAVNPKLERLLELVEQVPEDRKFVIFCEYIHSGRLICDGLTKLGIGHDWLYGGTADLRQLNERFNHDPKCRGLVIGHKVGAYSLNLQAANYVFIFEAPVSPIDDRQMRKRVARQGQTRVVFETDLLCIGTVDDRILAFHRQGQSLFDAIIKDPGIL